jgi:16S rRNA (cytosine1402-N4)-methyltransferase
MENPYHRPVMLTECIEALNLKPDGIYIDLTFGGGGHSRLILEKLAGKGRLLGFDQDPEAAEEAKSLEAPNFQFVAANFRHFRRYLRLYGVQKVDGILADLGISSHQIDTAERGFSLRFEGELDMRMNQLQSKTAKQILEEYSESDLHKILGMYGEVRNARTLAQAIVRHRANETIESTQEFKNILKQYAPRGRENKYYAQVFQALRIEVNEEMQALEEMLEQCPEALNPEGRLVVLSYHSLEDRPVKRFIQAGNFSGDVQKDLYGNPIKPLEAINRKPILPTQAEITENPRARSAKLRVAKK